jgi:hypothetical protein
MGVLHTTSPIYFSCKCDAKFYLYLKLKIKITYTENNPAQVLMRIWSCDPKLRALSWAITDQKRSGELDAYSDKSWERGIRVNSDEKWSCWVAQWGTCWVTQPRDGEIARIGPYKATNIVVDEKHNGLIWTSHCSHIATCVFCFRTQHFKKLNTALKCIPKATDDWFCSKWIITVVSTCSVQTKYQTTVDHITRVYPKVSGLATWSENWKSYTSLALGAVVSVFCESV